MSQKISPTLENLLSQVKDDQAREILKALCEDDITDLAKELLMKYIIELEGKCNT